MKKIIVISGATASGKSSLALDFAAFNDVSIINADALQVFKDLPILSAQPTLNDFEKFDHKLYSILEFNQEFSVKIWLDLVKKAIEESFNLGKIPLIVGGSGMYISKLIGGISNVPEIENSLKIKARSLYEEIGREKFIAELIAIGEVEENVKNLDKQRLIRLFEVLKQTGKTLKFWQKNNLNFLFDPSIFLHVNLEIDREKLYKNCDLRFEKMFENGAVQEVEALIKKGVKDDMQIAKTLGFSEISDVLKGNISKNEAIKIASQKTRNYAKRQLTWFRHQFDDKKTFNNQLDALNFLKNNI
jgi:tRNA dimethylallyltransferase